MRKIMFRGKRKDYNVWVYGFYSYLFDEKANDYKHEIVFQHMESADMSYPYPSCRTKWAEVIPETVGQYWRTVNDVDLYDGDIFTNNGKYSKIVRYKEDKACFCVAEYLVWQTCGYTGDEYSGFLLFPMKNGRYYKISYQC